MNCIMNAIKDEDEIKVEYFDTSEVDPLSGDNSPKHEPKHTTHSLSTNTDSNEIVNEDAISERTESPTINQLLVKDENNDPEPVDAILERMESPTINQLLVKDENNDPEPVEPEIETKWYKSVNNDGRYVCLYCDLSYSTTQTLRNHVRTKHVHNYNELKDSMISNLRKQKLKCHICKKKFTNTINLKEHIQTHGMKNIQKSCSVCHAVFEDSVEMLNHMKSEHKSLKRLHFCSICGYSTSKLSHFKQHENTHTSGNKTKCSHCDYSTNHLPNLKIHERIHTKDKPYACDEEGCSYRCAAKSALYSHRLKHDKEKSMLYCDKCSYSTVYRNSLNKHIDSHNRNSLRQRFQS